MAKKKEKKRENVLITINSSSVPNHFRTLSNQEAAAALAATEVAFMIEGTQRRGLQVTVAPGPAPTPGPAPSPHREPVQ